MCKLCETKPVYEFTNKREVCKSCFIRYVQKKFLYTIRKFGLIEKREVIGYEDNNDFRSVVLESLLEMFSEKGTVEIVKMPSKKKVNKIALALTTDTEANKIIDIFINGNTNDLKKRVSIKEKKDIKPLYLFLDKEILLYAKLKNLKFKKRIEKENKIAEFISEVEKKHPEVRHAIINSYLEIRK
ncbi:MAG: hypothetical protein OQK82_00625 [Candidatus Pacearchaeota archaeon]|nr:hypothetical protein [Candidatus Pacearchaeota archaeon]